MPDAPAAVSDAVVEALRRARPDLDAEDVADAFWMAAVLRREPRAAAPGAPVPPAGEEAGDHPASSITGAGRVQLYDVTGPGAPGSAAGSATIRGAGPLPDPLRFEHALRPFRRPWRTAARPELDLAATVDAYAQTRRLTPVLRPGPERWFEVVVIEDASPGMAVWRPTVGRFVRLLHDAGAFRRVRRLRLAFVEGHPALLDDGGRPVPTSRLRSPWGRTLLVICSDCSDAEWQSAPVWAAVRQWLTRAPAVLLNPLSPTLWRRVGLSLAGTTVRAGRPGVANTKLRFEPPPLLPAEGRIPLPIVSLTPAALGRWATALMRTDPAGCDAVLVPDQQSARRPVRPRPASRTTATGFQHLASEAAFRLAVLCSPYSAISVDLLHLIRRQLVPEATVGDLAEVLVGGIGTTTLDEGRLVFRLDDAVRAALLARLTADDAWRMYETLSRYVETATPGGGDLLIATAPSEGTVGDSRPFAEAAEEVLRLVNIRPAASLPLARPPGPRSEATTPLYFFLSYEDGDDTRAVLEFHRDLSAEIRALTGAGRDAEVGFAGGSERQRLDALAECRTFIALCSPAYFRSEPCGKEWAVFSRRIADDRGPLVRLLWAPVRHVPEVAQPYQLFSEAYSSDGLRHLLRVRRNRDEYADMLSAVARHVVAAARAPLLPGSRDSGLDGVTSAFHATDTSDAQPWGGDQPGSEAYFMLSHVRGMAPNRWVTAFYEDLKTAVEARATPRRGLRAESIYLETRSAAERRLAAGDLPRARVIVPLYTREFLYSVPPEFERYVRGGRAEPRPPVILPVLWDGDFGIRDAPALSQARDLGAGLDMYEANGLVVMRRLRTFAAEYQMVVDRLADRIVAAAENPGRLPAWATGDSSAVIDTAEFVPFLVSVLSPHGLGWRPFPDHTESLAEYAAETVRRLGLAPEVVEYRPSLTAGALPGVLLIDVWALEDAQHRPAVEDVLRNRPAGMALVAVADPSGSADESRLRALLVRLRGLADGPIEVVNSGPMYRQVIGKVVPKTRSNFVREHPAGRTSERQQEGQ